MKIEMSMKSSTRGPQNSILSASCTELKRETKLVFIKNVYFVLGVDMNLDFSKKNMPNKCKI